MKPAFKKTQRENASRTFSLIEMLLVMVVLMIVMALLLPALKTVRENARKGKCARNMGQYGVAFRLYQNDHKGMYPRTWVDDSHNWQSFLCGTISFSPYVGPNAYLSTNLCTFTGAPGPSKRIKGKLLCPTVAKRYEISEEGTHSQWGYCYNSTRVDISYDAANWPWFKPEYIGVDLDTVYPNSGISAVMACGNAASWNSDNDWNACTSADATDWSVQPVHGDVVNVLFMDGHVDASDVTETEGRNQFNFHWYNSIPSTMGNPW